MEIEAAKVSSPLEIEAFDRLEECNYPTTSYDVGVVPDSQLVAQCQWYARTISRSNYIDGWNL